MLAAIIAGVCIAIALLFFRGFIKLLLPKRLWASVDTAFASGVLFMGRLLAVGIVALVCVVIWVIATSN
jgi:hypothetical protein